MEKLIYHYYALMLARLNNWKEQALFWLRKNQYRLYFLAFACLVVYTKDLQFTIGMDGYAIANFQAIRPLPRLMSQTRSLLLPEKGGDEETSISWDHVLKDSKTASSPAAKAPAVQLPAPKTDRQRRQIEYVKRFAQVARIEMQKYGIPASITLAQGLLESDAGGSKLARKHNNHFGIKCHSKKCPKGHCVNYHDDSPKDFFRQYGTAWESFRAHSEFLSRDRYKPLHKLKATDYKGWARGLERAGYATGSEYAEKLIRLIEDLKLHQYDRM
jgi:flagellum-specific peptidoglycan hydrolase FlgJ